MSNKINSSTIGAGGLISTADGDDGILLIQSNGSTVATFNGTGILGDGSQLTNLPAGGGMTLLSTTAATGAATINVATNHTLYNQFLIVFKQVELSGTSGYLQMGVAGLTVMTVADVLTTSTTMIAGFTTVDLNANQFIQEIQLAATPLTTGNQFNGGSNQGLMMYEVDQNLRASASANVSFKYSSGAAFDGGSILIYGLK